MFFRFALYGFLKNLRFYDPFIILIFRGNGLSFLQIGLLYSVRELATHIFELPTGVLADAFGRKRAMVIAFLSYIVSFVVFSLFSSFWVYALAMVCFALGEAFRTGTHKALILEHLRREGWEREKVSYYGRTRSFSQLGSAINALLAASLVFFSGQYRFMFAASIVPYALNLINLMSYPNALDGQRVKLERGALGAQLKATLKNTFSIFKDLFALRAILNSAAFGACFKATKDYVQPLLKTFAVSLPLLATWGQDQRTALLVGAVFFLVYLLNSYASRRAQVFKQHFARASQALNLTFFVASVCLLVAGVAAWLDVAALSIVVYVLLYALFNLRKPLSVAFISDHIDSGVMASGLSIESQLTSLALVVLSPLLGALADRFGVSVALTELGSAMVLIAWLVRVKDRETA